MVSLEAFERFIKAMERDGIKVWPSGVQADLLQAFRRLDFLAWYDESRVFQSRYDDKSSTIEAIRRIRAESPERRPGPVRTTGELSYQA